MNYESLFRQVERTFLTVKTVVVPRATLVVHYTRRLSKSCNGMLATIALFGHSALVTVYAVDLLLMGGESGARQGFAAGEAHKALRVPRLVLVIHTSCGNGLEKE